MSVSDCEVRYIAINSAHQIIKFRPGTILVPIRSDVKKNMNRHSLDVSTTREQLLHLILNNCTPVPRLVAFTVKFADGCPNCVY